MTRAELIQYITDNVYPNARNEVTAPMVRDSLLEIVDFLGDAATYNIGMVASGNQGLVTGGNVNTAIALALLPYYTAAETGQAIDDAIARIGLGQAAYKNIGQVAENNTDLVTGGQVYTAINTALTSAIKFQGISDTPLTDGSTTNPIQINGQSYTAKKGDMVVYGGNEFLWVGNKWQQMGDESSYALKTIQITGTGYLTGGGDLTQSRTLDISATAKAYIDHGEAAYNYFPGGVLGSTHLPSMYIGTTSVQFSAAAQNLTGISSVRANTNVMTLFEWDSTNSAWHFHGNIYTDGWFSGGGISSGGGGGGGGGIDPVAMWRLLTNDPSLTQYDNYTKISADHINFPVTSVVGLTGGITAQQIAQALNLGSFAYKNSLSASDIPDLSGTYLPLSAGSTHPLTGDLYMVPTSGQIGLRIRMATGNSGYYDTCLFPGVYSDVRLTYPAVILRKHNGGNNDAILAFDNTNIVYAYASTAGQQVDHFAYVLHSNNYSSYALPLSGGTLTNSTRDFLQLNQNTSSAGAVGPYMSFAVNSTEMAFVGYNSIIGAFLTNFSNGDHYINVTTTGLKWEDTHTFIHTGNFSSTIDGRYLPDPKSGASSETATFHTYNNTTESGIGIKRNNDSLSTAYFGCYNDNAYVAVGQQDVRYLKLFGNGTITWNGYDIYHAGNSNKSNVAWEALSLTLHGAISGVTNIDSLLYFDSVNGRIGLGASSPAARFHIQSDAFNPLRLQSTNQECSIIFAPSNDSTTYGKFVVGANTSGNGSNNPAFFIYDATLTKQTFHVENGRVGINNGNTYPDYTLYVNGTHAGGGYRLGIGSAFASRSTLLLNSTAGNPCDIIFRSGTYTNDTWGDWTISSRGDSYGNNDFYIARGAYNAGQQSEACIIGINPSGNVIIGQSIYGLTASTQLDVVGVIHASTGIYTDGWFSGGGLASSSDRRLKKNIKNFAYTPKLLLAIRPREWDWKDGSAMVGHAAGFVAQEIEPIMPYAVDGTRNYKALFYDRFHALEISALQDHERRIKALENEVKQKDKEIANLKKRLNMN